MKYSLQYQYKAPADKRPEDYAQQNELTVNTGDVLVIPNVGDSVTLMLTKEHRNEAYKVLSQHFSYNGDWCGINIVVTDLERDEYAARVKD